MKVPVDKVDATLLLPAPGSAEVVPGMDLVLVEGLPEVPPGMSPPMKPGSEWIDVATGWVYRRRPDGIAMKVKPTAEQALVDVMRLRLLLADPNMRTVDVLRRTRWTSAYLRQVREKLVAWEEANISRASSDVILSQGLARIELAIKGLMATANDPNAPAGIRARAWRDVGLLGAKAIELGQDAGLVKRAPKQVIGRHLHLHATPEEARGRTDRNRSLLQKFVHSDGTLRRVSVVPQVVVDVQVDEGGGDAA